MTFRHPLRNQWDAQKDEIERLAKQPNLAGAAARMMHHLMPGFLDAIEQHRDRNDNPKLLMQALAGACANMIVQTVNTYASDASQRDALALILETIEQSAKPRLHGKLTAAGMNGSIIIPPEFR